MANETSLNPFDIRASIRTKSKEEQSALRKS